MGVYVSLSPAVRHTITPADIFHQLQSAGFSIAGDPPDESGLKHEIEPEGPHSTLFEMWDDRSNLVEVEINHNFPSHFCVWWRYSWSIGTQTYARELSHLLDLADRLGWELCGNTGKPVTRETLSREVEHLTGDSAAVIGMLGTVPSPLEKTRIAGLSAEASEMLDRIILQALEAMAKEDADESRPEET